MGHLCVADRDGLVPLGHVSVQIVNVLPSLSQLFVYFYTNVYLFLILLKVYQGGLSYWI